MNKTKKSTRRNVLMMEAIFIAILVIVLVIVLVLYLSGNTFSANSGEISAESAEILAESLENETESKKSTAKDYESGRILVEDSTVGLLAVPVLSDVEKNEYSWDSLTLENGRYTYRSDSVLSKTGIDVSYFQGEIDWERVRADGIDFVMIRLGYRGYGTGNTAMDSQFISNINGALNAGLDVGVYFFSQAVNTEEAEQEAELVLSMVQNYEITMPIVYDYEQVMDNGSRSREIDPDVMTANAVVFCETIKEAGYDAAFYATKKMALLQYDLTQLQEYGLWYEQADGNEPDFPYNFILWQYDNNGTVDGIEGNVSLNLYFDRTESAFYETEQEEETEMTE